jgi:hypothetical protein
MNSYFYSVLTLLYISLFAIFLSRGLEVEGCQVKFKSPGAGGFCSTASGWCLQFLAFLNCDQEKVYMILVRL